MTVDNDNIGEWLNNMAELEDRLKYDYEVPEELIDGFRKATLGFGGLSKQERLDAALPICSYLLKGLKEFKKSDKEGGSPNRRMKMLPPSVLNSVAIEVLSVLTEDFQELPELGALVAEIFCSHSSALWPFAVILSVMVASCTVIPTSGSRPRSVRSPSNSSAFDSPTPKQFSRAPRMKRLPPGNR